MPAIRRACGLLSHPHRWRKFLFIHEHFAGNPRVIGQLEEAIRVFAGRVELPQPDGPIMTVTCFLGISMLTLFQSLLFSIEGIQVANLDMCVHENIFSLYFTVYLFKLAESTAS